MVLLLCLLLTGEMWGFAPRPTKNFLGRKFLDFKELMGNIFV
jgi:hypothetical protein